MAISGEDWLRAQYSVLGAALLDPSIVPLVITKTEERDYSGSCLSVYKAIKDIFSLGEGLVDVVSVANRMGEEYTSFLAQLMAVTPTTANIEHYITICKEQSRVLALRSIGAQISESESLDAISKHITSANSLLVEKQRLQIVSMEDALNSFYSRHTGEKHYLTWPIHELDDRLYAEQGDLIILGGNPSAGKSAFALQFAWHSARTKRVGFYSLETSPEKLFDRQMSSFAGISMDDIKRNKLTDADWSQLTTMSSSIISHKLEIVPAAGMSVADIQAVATMRRHEIVIIDYLQLLNASGVSRYEQVTNISLALHRMAQTTGVTILALSQLSRVAKDDKSAPTMASLRESGQVEQDADIVLLLYLEDKDNMAGNRILKIGKNKEGTCPQILLEFDGKHQRFQKAKQTGTVVSQMKKDANCAKRASRATQQFEQLPITTNVPFEKA